MNIRNIVTSALAVLLIASTTSAHAQVSWQAFAERVGPKSLVVVQLTNGRRVEGHIVQVTETIVSVLPKTRIRVPVRHLALADIQSIEVEREGWSPGAKVLASVGAIAGAMAIITIAMLARGD
jgi:hypothetical protein